MHRASICDLQQPIALFFRQLAQKRDLPLNAVDHRARLFAMLTVSCVVFRVRQGGPYFAQRPSFAVRIHANRHVGARSQCGQQVLVRIGAFVVTAEILRLVRKEVMRADSYGLRRPETPFTTTVLDMLVPLPVAYSEQSEMSDWTISFVYVSLRLTDRIGGRGEFERRVAPRSIDGATPHVCAPIYHGSYGRGITSVQLNIGIRTKSPCRRVVLTDNVTNLYTIFPDQSG